MMIKKNFEFICEKSEQRIIVPLLKNIVSPTTCIISDTFKVHKDIH